MSAPTAGRKPDRASRLLARHAGVPAAIGGDTAREARNCPTCNGLGRVYSCDWWPRCGCPAGATADGCNGASRPCPDCAGRSGRSPEIAPWTRLAPPAIEPSRHERTMDLALWAGFAAALVLLAIGIALS